MGNVNAAGIWTPDEGDGIDPSVWSATMADSIMNGLGERMNKQEKQVSLRATTPVPFSILSTVSAYQIVPLTIAPVTGSRAPDPDFAGGNNANGIKMDGNMATIQTNGLYNLVGQITFSGVYTPHSWDFYGTVNGTIFGLPDYGSTSTISYTAGRVSDTRYLVAGDNIWLVAGVGTDHIGSLSVQDAMLSISMVYST